MKTVFAILFAVGMAAIAFAGNLKEDIFTGRVISSDPGSRVLVVRGEKHEKEFFVTGAIFRTHERVGIEAINTSDSVEVVYTKKHKRLVAIRVRCR